MIKEIWSDNATNGTVVYLPPLAISELEVRCSIERQNAYTVLRGRPRRNQQTNNGRQNIVRVGVGVSDGYCEIPIGVRAKNRYKKQPWLDGIRRNAFFGYDITFHGPGKARYIVTVRFDPDTLDLPNDSVLPKGIQASVVRKGESFAGKSRPAADIAERIYDYVAGFDKKETGRGILNPYQMIRSKIVPAEYPCSHRAELFDVLGKAAGIPTRTMSCIMLDEDEQDTKASKVHRRKPYTKNDTHAFNAYYNGEWHFADCEWGHFGKNFPPHFYYMPVVAAKNVPNLKIKITEAG